jgi:hypothetical protein
MDDFNSWLQALETHAKYALGGLVIIAALVML